MRDRMPKIAVISDIHGDLDALQQAFTIIKKAKCQKTICLGDVLDEGSENEKILKLLHRNNTICIRGNHEDLERVEQTAAVRQFLDECLEEMTINGFHFCHVIKRVPELVVRDRMEAWNIFDEFPWRLAFIGHNHIPALFVYDEHKVGEAVQIEPAQGLSYHIKKGTRCIVSVGSLAYGRDYFGRKSFVIYDVTASSVDFYFLKNGSHYGSVANDIIREMA
jgi:predicted phosphodiesterase